MSDIWDIDWAGLAEQYGSDWAQRVADAGQVGIPQTLGNALDGYDWGQFAGEAGAGGNFDLSQVPIIQDPGFGEQFGAALQKIGGGLWEAFSKNPMGFLTAGLGAGLTAYGLFKSPDGTYKKIATGETVQFTPQEQQLLDTLNTQIQGQSAVTNKLTSIYNDILGDPNNTNAIKTAFGANLGTMATQAGGQNNLTSDIYSGLEGTLSKTTPQANIINQTLGNSINRDSLVTNYQDMVKNRGGVGVAPDSGIDVNSYLPKEAIEAYGNELKSMGDNYYGQTNTEMGKDATEGFLPSQADQRTYLTGLYNTATEQARQSTADPGYLAAAGPELQRQVTAGAGMQTSGKGLFDKGAATLDKAGQSIDNAAKYIGDRFQQDQNDPVIKMLTDQVLAQGGSESDAQRIVDLYSDRVTTALTGQGDIDPTLTEEQRRERQALDDAALRSYGPGYETTSFYQQQLSDLNKRQEEARFTDRRQILTTDNEQRIASMAAIDNKLKATTDALNAGKISNAQATKLYTDAITEMISAQTELGGTQTTSGTAGFNAGTQAGSAAFNSATDLINAETSRKTGMGQLANQGFGNINTSVSNYASDAANLKNAQTNRISATGNLANQQFQNIGNLIDSYVSGVTGLENAKTNRIGTLQNVENSVFNNVLNSAPSGVSSLNQLSQIGQSGSISPAQSFGTMAGVNPGQLASNTLGNVGTLTAEQINAQLRANAASNGESTALLGAGGNLLGYSSLINQQLDSLLRRQK